MSSAAKGAYAGTLVVLLMVLGFTWVSR